MTCVTTGGQSPPGMILFKQAKKLSQYLRQAKQNGTAIGFVPTMGALHQGHLSLLEAARKNGGLVITSIFVNPTQFNNPEDFRKYPNTLEDDIRQLAGIGCDVLFLPTATEIYPAGYRAPVYPLHNLETRLEGQYRPGHFQGVCQVVDRLLAIVDPHFLFLGQKDFQQCMVIAELLRLTKRERVALTISPTVREADGLAMSSRNLRLTAAQRTLAPALYAALQNAKEQGPFKTYRAIEDEAVQHLTAQGFRVDYFVIADAATLLPATAGTAQPVALVAAYLGDIRLIDNLPLY